MGLYTHISSGGWLIDTLVATVLRPCLTPSTRTTYTNGHGCVMKEPTLMETTDDDHEHQLQNILNKMEH
jgi:hypothetical protein